MAFLKATGRGCRLSGELPTCQLPTRDLPCAWHGGLTAQQPLRGCHRLRGGHGGHWRWQRVGGPVAGAKESEAVKALRPAWDCTWPRPVGGGCSRAGQPQCLGWGL